MASELRIAPARRQDIAAVAALHGRAFPDAALTAFGPEAVSRYYLWLLEGPHDAALVLAWRDDRLLGFCAAGWFRGAMRGFLRANRLYLAGRVVRHPSLLRTELVRERIILAARLTLRFSRLAAARTKYAAVPQDVRRFGVLSIATDPDARGSGAGRALMSEAEERARRDGYASMVLTVHPDNTRAVLFYEQLGWQRLAKDGQWAGNMEKRLT